MCEHPECRHSLKGGSCIQCDRRCGRLIGPDYQPCTLDSLHAGPCSAPVPTIIETLPCGHDTRYETKWREVSNVGQVTNVWICIQCNYDIVRKRILEGR